jgi:hypothetical protein
MNQRTILQRRMYSRTDRTIGLATEDTEGHVVSIDKAPTHISERDSLYIELEPLFLRLTGATGSSNGLIPDEGNVLYDRFCKIYSAYDPSYGFPLRPYLVRHLTALFQSNSHANALGASDGAAPRRMRDAIENLPTSQREAVTLRYYYGKQIGDIARRLDVDPGAASAILDAGLDTLRYEMGQDAAG